MLIFDAHLDLALNAIDLNRDLRQSVDDIRAQELSLGMSEPGRCTNTLSFPELRSSEVAVCLTTLLARREEPINHHFGWTTPQACYAIAHAHLSYYRAMEQAGYLRMIRTGAELRNHFECFGTDPAQTPLGFILTMEGADPLFETRYDLRVSSGGIASPGAHALWCQSIWGGTRSEVGLALDALPLLKYCEELGIVIDMTHLSDVAFWQVAERFQGRIHASHQNARHLQLAAAIQR